jgi:hypothetical protein
MNGIQRALASATMFCLAVLIPASCYAGPTSPSQLLYVQDGHNLITYSVTSGSATKLGTLFMNASTDFPIQVFHAPKAPFLYILGFTSATDEYFWVHATTSAGVPTENAIQQLAVRPALSQFFIHPNGKSGYALYAWSVGDQSVSDIVLYTVSPETGKLTNTHTPVANFPASFGQTAIYGISANGSKLYDQSQIQFDDANAVGFDYYDINETTGLLGPSVNIWSLDTGTQGGAVYILNDKLLVFSNSGLDPLAPGIYVYPNVANTSTDLFYCSPAMLNICGDNLNYPLPLRIDPSGKYLFVNDDSIHSVVIAAIDLTHGRLQEEAGSIPGNPSIISFSPDGTFVYAVEDKNVLIYGFNPSSGLLTTERSVSFPLSVGGIVTASHP